jgi:uncharacterized YigZ family protein
MSDTLAAPAAHSIDIRHSRFLAQAAAVDDVADALHFLATHSDRDATHNCWAYRIGAEYRSSDDGEPAGTAGRPILAAIDGQDFDRVVVVVTRWYGGIKLGAGGLVRAYGGAAAGCLRTASRRQLVAMCELTVQAPFADIGAVHAAFAAHMATKLDETFGSDGVTLRCALPADRADALKVQLRDSTRDRVRIEPARFEPTR